VPLELPGEPGRNRPSAARQRQHGDDAGRGKEWRNVVLLGRRPDGPFVTLIAVAATYLNPENYDLDSLKELAKREGNEEMRVFKRELREALRDLSQLPDDELFESVEYDDGSYEAFLRRLWFDLYGDEPVRGAARLLRPGCGFP
jgi:hypothetical protein